MYVKMLTMGAGPSGVFPSGSIREVTEQEGAELIAGRFAEEVKKPTKMESAALSPGANAAMPPVGARKIAVKRMDDEA